MSQLNLEMLGKEKEPILIIDDSEAILLLIEEFLKKMEYHEIHKAKNGNDGIEQFKEIVKNSDKVPIVLLDYNLPDMNAFSVFSQLIKLKPTTKVVIETAMEKESMSIKQLIASGASKKDFF